MILKDKVVVVSGVGPGLFAASGRSESRHPTAMTNPKTHRTSRRRIVMWVDEYTVKQSPFGVTWNLVQRAELTRR